MQDSEIVYCCITDLLWVLQKTKRKRTTPTAALNDPEDEDDDTPLNQRKGKEARGREAPMEDSSQRVTPAAGAAGRGEAISVSASAAASTVPTPSKETAPNESNQAQARTAAGEQGAAVPPKAPRPVSGWGSGVTGPPGGWGSGVGAAPSGGGPGVGRSPQGTHAPQPPPPPPREGSEQVLQLT